MLCLSGITPVWPAPDQVKAYVSTRQGGFSQPPYDSFNTATHVGDDPIRVAKNRSLLIERLSLNSEPVWLNQVHSTQVVAADQVTTPVTADAVYTKKPGVVCVVQTADCLSLLLCHSKAMGVAAIHAGWRGLAAGIIESTIKVMQLPEPELLVWLGPAIGPQAFIVNTEVYTAFTERDPQANAAFQAIGPQRWFADLYLLAKQRLQRLGITAIYGGGYCTYRDSKRFFSFRRDRVTGRMSSLIWLNSN